MSAWDWSEEFGGAAVAAPTKTELVWPQPGHYTNITDEEYFAADAINNSSLSLVNESVSDYIQFRDAPKNEEKMKVFEFGSATHMMVTQPELFKQTYIQKPAFNLRTNKGKADSLKWDEEHKEFPFILDENDYARIEHMKECLLADPRASFWLAQDGWAESVVTWIDEETGLLCKLKADWLVEMPDCIVCIDFKTADTIDKFKKDFFKLRYDVQDHHYSKGLVAHFKKPVLFMFLVCSKTIEIGRYPTWCGQVNAEDKPIAEEIWRGDANKLAEAIKNNDWIEYNTISRTASSREWHYAKYK